MSLYIGIRFDLIQLFMDKKRRYKCSKVRDKQPLIRSLKTFSSQYRYLYCDNEFIDFNEEPVSLYFSDEYDNSLNMIYSNEDLKVNIRDYNFICDAVDSLFGIGKTQWKEDLKKEIFEYGGKDFNYFLDERFESNAREIINNYISNSKVYTYLKNYVSFYNSGVYDANKRDKITIKPISLKESIEKRLSFLLKAKKLYEETVNQIKDNYEDIDNEINEWMKNKNFDSDALDKDNTSYFHPIDDSEQSYTLHMIERKKSGIYDEDILNDLHDWVDNLKEIKKDFKKTLKTFSYSFDLKFNFESMEDFRLFEIPELEETFCYELLEDLREEIVELKETKVNCKNLLEEFLKLSKEQLDEYDFNWLKEQLELWENELNKSKYTHKLDEIEKYILNTITSKEIIKKFKELILYSRKISLDKRVDLNYFIKQLDEALDMDYFEDEDFNVEEHFKKCQDALLLKDDYQISDIDFLIDLELVKDERDYICLEKEYNKLQEEKIDLENPF
ncbi:hypothetical protein [Arcobacter acticola]|uniref:hypothetical protein n=1 Tax=Arcobacter acticola TaxID=1849015 RepID=UPI0015542810|nr:hypothetical protein [Arcobacter acticola]